MYTHMYTLYVSQCLPRVFKMARWIGRVGGYQRPGNDKELRWSLWPFVWSGPLLMTIVDQDATISHLFTGFFWLLPQTRAGNMKFLVLKVNSKTSNSRKIPRFFFLSRKKKHKLPRYCLHCCFVDVREPWLCLLGMVCCVAPPTAMVYQGKACRWWSPNWSHVKVESLSVAKGWGNPEVLWHVTMLQFCKKAVIWARCWFWMIWEMILPEEKGNFTFSDSWVRPFPRRFQCRVVFLLRLIWACCSDHGTSAVPSSTSSTMTAGVCESLAGCCV